VGLKQERRDPFEKKRTALEPFLDKKMKRRHEEKLQLYVSYQRTAENRKRRVSSPWGHQEPKESKLQVNKRTLLTAVTT